MDKEVLKLAGILLLAGLSPLVGYAADYEKLAAEFVKLGMPDVAGAEYVRAHHGGQETVSHKTDDPNRLLGNMWIVERRTNQTMQVVGRQRFKVEEAIETPAKFHAIKVTAEQYMAKQQPDPELIRLSNLWDYTFESADLTRDLRIATSQIQQRINDNDGVYFDHESCDLYLFGLQAVRSGKLPEGSALLRKVDEYAGDGDALANCLKDNLANYQYLRLYRKFSSTGHWTNFLTGIEQIRHRFKSVWKADRAAQQIVLRIKRQLANPEPPPIKGPDLTAEDHQLAAELANPDSPPSDGSLHQYNEFWPLSSKGIDTYEIDIIDRIKLRGRRSVPLLLALANDQHLVPVRRDVMGPLIFMLGCSSHPNQTKVATENTPIPQPFTRGRIAIALLRPLVDDESFSDKGAAEIVAGARRWYKLHKDKSEKELLLHYAQSDHDDGNRIANKIIWDSDEEWAREHVLESLSKAPIGLGTIRGVASYHEKKGDVIREFVIPFVRKAEQWPADIPNKAEIQSELKKIRDQLAGKTHDDYLLEVISGASSWRDVSWPIYQSLEKVSESERRDWYLDSAAKVEDPLLALHILHRTPYDTNSVSPAWAKVLARDLPYPMLFADTSDEKNIRDRFFAPTFAHQVAVELEFKHANWQDRILAENVVRQLGKMGADIVLARAHARLGGKRSLPALPKPVNAKRIDSLHVQLRNIAPNTIEEFVGQFTPAEQLSLPEVWEKIRPNAALSARANQLVNLACHLDSPKLKKHLNDRLGRPIDATFMEQLMTLIREFVVAGNSGVINLTRSRPFGGISVETSTPSFNRKQLLMNMGHSPDEKIILGKVRGSGPNGDIRENCWIILGRTGAGGGSGVPIHSEAEERATFLKAVERLLDPRANCAAPLHIQLLIVDWATFK